MLSKVLSKGQKVVHHLYGVGTVEKIEEKKILGKPFNFSLVSFQEGRLKVMVNLNQKNNLIRGLISKDEVPRVIKFLKQNYAKIKPKSSERYNINLKKIKTTDVYQLAEVIKDLSDLGKTKKLTPKEQEMLKQSKKVLSSELSIVKKMDPEKAELMLDKIFQN